MFIVVGFQSGCVALSQICLTRLAERDGRNVNK